MERFEDSIDLFGLDIGGSTVGEITCGICGETYNSNNEDEDGKIIDPSIDGIGNTMFAGIIICECCYGDIEREIIKRIKDIIPWYQRILKKHKKEIEKAEKIMEGLKDEDI